MNYDESVRALMSLGRELAAPRQARLEKFGLDNIRILAADLGFPAPGHTLRPYCRDKRQGLNRCHA